MNTRKYVKEYYDLLYNKFFEEHSEEEYSSYIDIVLYDNSIEWAMEAASSRQLKKLCGDSQYLGNLVGSKLRFSKNDNSEEYIEMPFITPELAVALIGPKKLNNDPEKTYLTTYKVETGFDGSEYDAYYPESTPCRYTLFTNGYVNNSKGKWHSKNNYWNPLIKKQNCGNKMLYKYYDDTVFIVEK